MADDNIDFRFLGRQVQRLQADVRDLRGDHLRLEGDVAGLRADVSRLEEGQDGLSQQSTGLAQQMTALAHQMENHHQANQAQFREMAQTDATNLELLLAAINSRGSSS